ncbi:CRISPR system precrRNA processing endoribonuclease RAMP protein Cas6 [Halochromatium glycolicum]|nr:CRISPR system precrRNA processing endoribonuclease RAMP protein Cas6 [Halochromatium glycolicum]
MDPTTASLPANPLPAPALRLTRLRFDCDALEPIHLPAYSGSAWRGLIGRSLRHSVCVTRQPTCDGCLLRSQCAYSTFFESPPASPETAARYSALPHPFVLEPGPPGRRTLEPGAPLSVGLTLIGPAGALTPYLIHALQRAGARGLGRQGGRFRLVAVQQETRLGSDQWQAIYRAETATLQPAATQLPAPGAAPDQVRLALHTPVRLKRQGRYLGPRDLDARALLGTLSTRIALLAELYGDGPPAFERAPLHAAIDRITLTPAQLHWVEWTRYSSRQGTRMQLGGVLGTLQLHGPGLTALWPLLTLGQWLHVGKATSFGLGGYRLQPAASPDP